MIANEHESSRSTKTFNFGVRSFLAITVLAWLVGSLYISRNAPTEIPYSEFLNLVDAGQVASLIISNERIEGERKSSKGASSRFVSIPTTDEELIPKLREKRVEFRVERQNQLWPMILSWVIPLFFFYWLWSRMAGRAGGAPGLLSLTKSKAKMFVETDVKTTFAEVAGIDEAKVELHETVEFLRNPQQHGRLGGRAPKGILLIGPPGTGKTLLARAIAGEAKVPFFSINGSEFVELFVGLGAARVRDLFEQARKQAPCILFIHEIDAVGKSRGSSPMGFGANDEKEQTLNQLLAEMDGFDPSAGVIMLAATNRPETLDPALLRAGRFDRQVLIGMPDRAGRIEILKVHAQKIKLAPEVEIDHIASLTSGFSGADLANLVNEAALVATRRNADSVNEQDLVAAFERIVTGLELRSKVIHPKEKRRIAFHELGHATVALSLDVRDRVQKVSIVPRGIGALGYTLQRPTDDYYLLEQGDLFAKITVLVAGRAAEMVFYHTASTGGADDLVKATDMAHAMVTQYGMSRIIGLPVFETRNAVLSRRSLERFPSEMSQETAREIDLEVRSILDRALQSARRIIFENQAFIENAAERLLEVETLNEDAILTLWKKSRSQQQEVQNDFPQPSPRGTVTSSTAIEI